MKSELEADAIKRQMGEVHAHLQKIGLCLSLTPNGVIAEGSGNGGRKVEWKDVLSRLPLHARISMRGLLVNFEQA